ncbi:MAG: glycosyltransferase [Acidimicrobiia bacterium]
MTSPSGSTSPVVCLLPARNAAAQVDDWLASIGALADAVVALDDGSEDDTAALLRAHPLVAQVLENPRRSGYAGWDDAANRARLLGAARALDPAWIMQLDADERMSADDARALRTFLLDGADPAFAYAFRVYRMVGDRHHYDADHAQWVCRCFAYDPTHRLPTTRLHLVPVPTAFPPGRRRRTTFRIQHLVGLTADDRRRQFDKYREVDPDRRFQDRYDHLLAEPTVVRPWPHRSPALHALANEPAATVAPTRAADAPALSAVVVDLTPDVGTGVGASDLTARVGALVRQASPLAHEVLAVVGPDHPAAADLDATYPGVRVVVVDRGIGEAAARAEGFRNAGGRHLVAPRGRAAPGYVAALLAAHAAGWALVAGVVDTDAAAPAGLAVHALEHWDELPGTPAGRLSGPPPECSYVRDAWEELGGPDGPDRVNAAMYGRGYSAGRARDAVTVAPGRDHSPRDLLIRCFARGRAHGRVVAQERARDDGRPLRDDLLRATVAGPVPARRTLRALRATPPELRSRLRRAAPLLATGALATWAGGAYGFAGRVGMGAGPRRRRPAR